MRQSERMFEVSTFGYNTSAETFPPLVDGIFDKTLLYTSPHVNQRPLQIVSNLPDLCLANSVLHNNPDLVVDRITVWAIRRPQIWRDECRCVTFQETDGVTCPVCRGTVLLKNEEFARNLTTDRQQHSITYNIFDY